MNVSQWQACLPADLNQALLVGRAVAPGAPDDPCVVLVRRGEVFDLTPQVRTVADLLDRSQLYVWLKSVQAPSIGPVQSVFTDAGWRLLAPCDLQPVKACGVTFAVSLLERVIEEQAHGDPGRAAAIRQDMTALVGTAWSNIKPGSTEAARLREDFVRRGQWSQYLEVGLGPDAEVFSKAPAMASVGFGADVGLHPVSKWNNPEPEIVLAVSSRGEVVGATLGNDVNLRDVEGRSALLLGKAKDNNASCAIGPFIRVFDAAFTLDTVRQATVSLEITGDDGFSLQGESRMAEISRDPLDLVAQTFGAHHQYPDGFMLFLGTMFSPIKDRDAPGGGFTHHLGDRVRIATPSLGALVNGVQHSTATPPWTFGVRALYASLAHRFGDHGRTQ